MPGISRINKKEMVVFWIGLMSIAVFMHSSHLLDSDEGIVLNGAWQLLSGGRIYHDFYELAAPGSFYLIYFFWKLFGANYLIAKAVSLAFLAGSAYGIFRISAIFTSREKALLAPAVFVLASASWPLVQFNLFSELFMIWAVYFFLRYISDPKPSDLVLCGLASGLTAVFLQHKGALLVAILTVLLAHELLDRKRDLFGKLLLFYAAVFFGALPLLPHLKSLLIDNHAIFPPGKYLEINRAFPGIFASYAFLSILSFLALRMKKIKQPESYLFVLQFCFLISALQRPDYYHSTLMSFPLIALLPLVLADVREHDNPMIKKLTYVAFAACAVTILSRSALYFYKFPPLVSLENYPAYRQAEKACASSEYIYAGPFQPGWYFELRKKNPTPHYVIKTNFTPSVEFLRARDLLKEKKPGCIITNDDIVKKFSYSPDNPLDEFIMQEYVLEYESGGYRILLPRNK